MATQPVIQTNGLTKAYKRGAPSALNQLDLTVNQGEIFGYLGPNGAGKTTTIRLLLDFIRPSAGTARIFGLDANHDSVELHRRIGYLPGELNLWNDLTGKQVINYLGSIRGNHNPAYVQQLTERLTLDLSPKIRNYSTGNRRKLGLVIALMHQPELLILDEPTNGLDPLVQQVFHEMMREVRNAGKTVFLSSHILSEVQAICERVAILRDGKLQAVQRVADLVQVKFHWMTLMFKKPVNIQHIAAVPGVDEVSAEGNKIRLRLTGDFDPLMRALSSEYVVEIHTEEPSLEEIFLTFYGNKMTQKATTVQADPVKEVVR